MKKQVNLFDPQLVPISQPYNFQRLTLVLLVLVLVFLTVWGLIYAQQHQTTSKLKQIEQQLKQEQTQLAQFQLLLTQRAASTDLLRQQDRLQQVVDRQQRLLGLLTTQQSQPQRLFSNVMQHLNEVDAPQLWLTEFKLQQRRSEFHGQTIQPSVVPDWMSSLSDLPYFQGQRFQGLTLQQTESGETVSFHVIASQGEML